MALGNRKHIRWGVDVKHRMLQSSCGKVRWDADSYRAAMTQILDEPTTGAERAILTAVRHHQAGRLIEAEGVYRAILAEDADQPVVLHLLGALCGQMGRNDAAIELVSRAIGLREDAGFYDTLGRTLKAAGRLEDAISAYRKAIELKPDFAAAQNNLGVALRAAGRIDESKSEFRAAIAVKPDFADAMLNLGTLLVQSGEFGEAVSVYQRAMGISSGNAEAWNNFGIALYETGSLKESVSALQKALQLRPGYAEALNNLGNTLRRMGRLADAIGAYQSAVDLKPGYAQALNNLGVAQWESGLHEQATGSCRAALKISPDFAEAHNTLGNVLRDGGDLDRAAAHFETALNLKFDYAEAHANLAVVLKDQARHEEALDHARRAIAIRADHAAHSNLIYLRYFDSAGDPTAIAAEQAAWYRLHAEQLGKGIAKHANIREADRRLRIGYIGPYFRRHVVGLNILPLLREHRHSEFEIFCYADVLRSDPVTEECRRYADQWRDIVGMDDEAVADLIRQDGIDILVDLSLHLSGNRLLTAARKPAPIQAAFAGYPGGTGLRTIDYRITDRYLDDPMGKDGEAFEKPICLSSFWCYDETVMGAGIEPVASALPAKTAGHITFGCLNNFCKVNDGVLQVWARVLREVANSKLILLAPAGTARRRTANRFAQLGVATDRIEFVGHLPRREYFWVYNRIDIGLDTFPYNGHTTSLDSLWMGVPVVTLAGSSVIGRAGVSQLSNLGLTELIGRTADEFVEIAKGLSANLERLSTQRAGLRDRMRASPIINAKAFAREIESAYRTMWVKWCASAP
jgi:protein O-GlcNAc transferase